MNIFHVKQLFSWFPDATILFIYRNPIDVLRSEVNKPQKRDYPLRKKNLLYASGLVMFVFFEWLLAAVIALYNNAVHKEYFFVISYEYLSAHQELSVQKVCSAIKIEFKENLCEAEKIASSYSDGKKREYWYNTIITNYVR